MINIINTFEDFKKCFANNLDLSTEEKIKLWEECYISKYPELEHKCKVIMKIMAIIGGILQRIWYLIELKMILVK